MVSWIIANVSVSLLSVTTKILELHISSSDSLKKFTDMN